ncbi:MAG: beta-ketoacyl synthase [Tannerella sp.]|jgi:3-oxoacyl-[acyl-carrier-protein] synthase-1|nr:beta-ketoacyl synthase [Tannerella sp.]
MEKKIRSIMTTLLSDNIISSLGFTTNENYQKVKQGKSGLRFYSDYFDLPEPFVVSMIDEEKLDDAFYQIPNASKSKIRYSKLEKAAVLSVTEALKHTEINPAGEQVLFILSTTKGNIFLLDAQQNEGYEPEQLYLWRSAELIAGFFGNNNSPMVISNACISGAYALISAQRALESGRYNYAIVVGVDMLSRFIISGFQSFKALSQSHCRPFDANRDGLNVGEVAATVILAGKNESGLRPHDIVLSAGAICNDANHISGPSRTGEGAFLALRQVCSGIKTDELAYITAHGTATPYNDEMEAIAITRASLQHIPVNTLKGYFGHTLGGAGVVESIISTRSLKDRLVLKTQGFETLGVSHPLQIVTQNQAVTGTRCINMLSGFGGCNAALLYSLVE